MSNFHRYSELGEFMATQWGANVGDISRREAANRMNSDQRLLCVLSAIYEELRFISSEAASEARRRRQRALQPNNEISDGMLRWMHGKVTDRPISEMEPEMLSPRAHRALRESGVLYKSQITRNAFTECRNGGPVTIKEIMTWASR